MSADKTDTKGITGIIIGASLMLIGSLILSDKMGWMDAGNLWRAWPLVLIGLGLSKLVQTWGTIEAGSGLWLLFGGAWVLAVNYRIFGMTFQNSWPIVIVAVGLSMIVRAFLEGGNAKPDQEADHGN